jgi:hypothetical protein
MELFQPDMVLASQFFATLRRQGPSKRGEWHLVVAVLEDAISCFQKHALARDSHGRRLFREAYEWIMVSQSHGAPPFGDDAPAFTFDYICEVLGFDPDYIRRGLKHWRQEQLAGAVARIQSLPKQAQRSPFPASESYGIRMPLEAASGGVPA